jgi:hypothetical protein
MHANIRTELLDDCLVDRAIEKYRLRIAELEQELETL